MANTKLPDIFIVGAAKSGTTTLSFLLSRHPKVFMPRKEPGFFAFHGLPTDEIPEAIRDNQIIDFEEYKALYEGMPSDKVALDASVANLTFHQNAIHNFQQIFGDSVNSKKFIIILRNPVGRAFSHYKMLVKNGYETLSFEEAIKPENVKKRIHLRGGFDYLGNSFYYNSVKAYMDRFPNVKVWLNEDLKDQEKLCSELVDFTDLGGQIEVKKQAVLNVSGKPKAKFLVKWLHRPNALKTVVKNLVPASQQHRLQRLKAGVSSMNTKPMHLAEETKLKLAKHFEPEVRKLEDLLQRDLSKWMPDHE